MAVGPLSGCAIVHEPVHTGGPAPRSTPSITFGCPALPPFAISRAAPVYTPPPMSRRSPACIRSLTVAASAPCGSAWLQLDPSFVPDPPGVRYKSTPCAAANISISAAAARKSRKPGHDEMRWNRRWRNGGENTGTPSPVDDRELVKALFMDRMARQQSGEKQISLIEKPPYEVEVVWCSGEAFSLLRRSSSSAACCSQMRSGAA